MKKYIFAADTLLAIFFFATVGAALSSHLTAALVLFACFIWDIVAVLILRRLYDSSERISALRRELALKQNLVQWHAKQTRMRDTRIKQLNNTIKQFRENRDNKLSNNE